MRVASSMYFSSINTETLISEVEIIWMLMPSSASKRNIIVQRHGIQRTSQGERERQGHTYGGQDREKLCDPGAADRFHRSVVDQYRPSGV